MASLEETARCTFRLIRHYGLKQVREKWNKDLKYGIEIGLFTQEDIEREGVLYYDNRAMAAFRCIKSHGFSYITILYETDLNYGLEKRLFTQEKIDAEQQKFLVKKAEKEKKEEPKQSC